MSDVAVRSEELGVRSHVKSGAVGGFTPHASLLTRW